MFALLLTPEYALFGGAFFLMIGIGVIEAVGLGIGHFDFDADLDGVGHADLSSAPGVLDWLGLKTGLPILIWATSLLGCFTLAGVAIQQTVTAILGAPLHWAIAGAAALALGTVINGFTSAGLARLIPEYESTVIDTEDLIMRRGTIMEGTARRGHPARAKVIDQHGQAHYIMAEPHEDGDIVSQGETALLVRKDGPTFFVIPDTSTVFRPV